MTIDSAKYSAPVLNSPADSPDRSKLWMAAIKPPMYSVAIMPIALGTAVAYAKTQSIRWDVFGIFLMAAILILAWENLHNDLFDAETGIDHNKHHSVVNLTGNKSLVFWLGTLCLATGISGILAIAYLQQDPTILLLILMCCGLGYLYQGPPFRLGYQGLGEILCFFSFGPLAVSAAYYSQTQTWSSTALVISVILGISTSLILLCSHFHQVEDDLNAGKRSPIVQLGTLQGARLLPWLCSSLYALTVMGVAIGSFPLSTLMIFGSLPSASKLCRYVLENHDKPDNVKNCKFIAVALHFWSGLLLSLGFIL